MKKIMLILVVIMGLAGIVNAYGVTIFQEDSMDFSRNGIMDQAYGWTTISITRDMRGRIIHFEDSVSLQYFPQCSIKYYGNTKQIKEVDWSYSPASVRQVFRYNKNGTLQSIMRYSNGLLQTSHSYDYKYYNGSNSMAMARRTVLRYDASHKVLSKNQDVMYFYRSGKIKEEIHIAEDYDARTGLLAKYERTITLYDKLGNVVKTESVSYGLKASAIYSSDGPAISNDGKINYVELSTWIDAYIKRDPDTGRITGITQSVHAWHSPEWRFDYYDSTHCIKQVTYYFGPAAINDVYCYNEDGALKSINRYRNGLLSESISYDYKCYSGTTFVKMASRSTVRYNPFSDTAPSDALDYEGKEIKYFYKNGNTKRVITATKEYDHATGWLLEEKYADTRYSVEGVISSMSETVSSYEYYSSGNIKSRTENINRGERITVYTYYDSEHGRLKSKALSRPDGNGNIRYDYYNENFRSRDYGRISKITKADGSHEVYAQYWGNTERVKTKQLYDSTGNLVATYQYGINGNLISKKPKEADLPDKIAEKAAKPKNPVYTFTGQMAGPQKIPSFLKK